MGKLRYSAGNKPALPAPDHQQQLIIMTNAGFRIKEYF
jgi:hypothetical protein